MNHLVESSKNSKSLLQEKGNQSKIEPISNKNRKFNEMKILIYIYAILS